MIPFSLMKKFFYILIIILFSFEFNIEFFDFENTIKIIIKLNFYILFFNKTFSLFK